MFWIIPICQSDCILMLCIAPMFIKMEYWNDYPTWCCWSEYMCETFQDYFQRKQTLKLPAFNDKKYEGCLVISPRSFFCFIKKRMVNRKGFFYIIQKINFLNMTKVVGIVFTAIINMWRFVLLRKIY